LRRMRRHRGERRRGNWNMIGKFGRVGVCVGSFVGLLNRYVHTLRNVLKRLVVCGVLGGGKGLLYFFDLCQKRVDIPLGFGMMLL